MKSCRIGKAGIVSNSLSEASVTFILKPGKNWEKKLSGQSKVNRQNIIANLQFSDTYTERNDANYNGNKKYKAPWNRSNKRCASP